MKKSLLTAIVISVIIIAIIFLETQKPNIERPQVGESGFQKAPGFVAIDAWINSEPLDMNELRGKVVLVDFWTYSCINCIRTLPYLREWDKKYRDKGLVIVGVHTPEFDFEKKYENVLSAVKEHQLAYPVALDNEYGTWRNYQNRYWPHKFLIDADGNIRYDHVGEGGYAETEAMIQKLLSEKGNMHFTDNMTSPTDAIEVDYAKIRTPEIYFGYNFARGNFGNQEGIKPEQIVSYSLPEEIVPNNVYFKGNWSNKEDYFEMASEKGTIILIYQAKYVNIVAGSENGSKTLVSLDQKKPATYQINESKLYNIAVADYQPHIINITVEGRGFRIYTFTFG